MKNRKTIGSLAALGCMLLSAVILFVAISGIRNSMDLSRNARQVQHRLEERLALMDVYMQEALQEDHSLWMDLNGGVPEDMVIYRYCSDTLQSWCHQFPIRNDDISEKIMIPVIVNPGIGQGSPLLQISSETAFVNLGNSWYLGKSVEDGDCRIVAGLWIIDIDAHSSQSRINERLRLGERVSVMPLDYSGGEAVEVDGKPLFKLARESLGMEVNPSLVWVSFLLVLAAAGLYLWGERSFRRFRLSLATALVATVSLYLWGRTIQNQYSVFSPMLYAGSDLLYSLGAVFLLNLLIFVVAYLTYMMRRRIAETLKASRRGLFCVAAILLSCLILVYTHFSLTSIIRNSGLTLELYKFSDLSLYSVAIYLSYILMLSSVPLLLAFVPLLSGGRRAINPSQRVFRVIYSIIVSGYMVAVSGSLGFERERNRTEVWSNRLALDRDINFEMLLRSVEQQIADDSVIAALVSLDNNGSSVRSRITDLYLPRLDRQYSISVYVLNGSWPISDRNAQFASLVGGGIPISEGSHFLYVDLGTDASYYIGVFQYLDPSEEIINRLLLRIDRRQTGEDRGYGRIFGHGTGRGFNLPEGYSYARYEGRKLKSCSGNYAYPTLLNDEKYVQAYASRGSVIRMDGYTHFVNVITEDEAVLITRKKINDINYVIELISVAILAFLILSILTFRGRNRNVLKRSYFKNRIIGVLLLSLTLILLTMTAVSVLFVYNRNEANLRDVMFDKIGAISKMMNAGMRDYSSFDQIDFRQARSLVARVGTNTSSDLTLYSPEGLIYMSTTPVLFDRNMLSPRMDGEAYDNIMYRNARFHIQKEKVEGKLIHCLYAPIIGQSGNVIAIVSSPYTEENYDFENDAIIHSATVISIFLLLLMAALFTVAAVVDRLFKPLSEMSVKMSHADLDSLEYIRYDRKDEISSLVDSYNLMVTELSENTRKLAQAERDKAWSGMARQVAHEIKNPLTPMKLQLQRIIRLKQKGDPAWQSLFDEASKVFLDHIDILTETANDFSTFAKLYTQDSTELDLDRMLREEIAMFDNRDNIKFDYFGFSDALAVGPKPQLTRVFVNLISNAVQAVGDAPDGHIVISLRNAVEDGYYDIVFEDNGPGVSDENVGKLFTPNFTTKSGGSGLGLAISRSVLERCSATIAYSRSFSLKGACFTIKYPK